MAEKADLEKENQVYIDAKKPAALFGEQSSGLHTSIDSIDVKMMIGQAKDS